MTPSVYVIDETLSALMLMREEEGISEAERAAIDGQIEAWMASEVAKVDRVRAYLLHCKVMREAAAGEKDRQAAREKQWTAREERLKGIVQYVMEAREKRRYEGATGVLRLQASGGMRALTITDPSLVPDEYRVATIQMRVPDLMKWLRYREITLEAMVESGAEVRYSTDNAAVRKALEQKCKACGGTGDICPSGPSDAPMEVCVECDGTGGRTVAGARLEPRGDHLRVE